MARRSILGFLLILSSSELSRIAPRSVFAAGGGGEGGTLSSDYPLLSSASSFSSSSLQKQIDFSLPASLRNYRPPKIGEVSVLTPSGTPEDHWSNEDLSTRVARAKRQTLLRDVDKDDAHLANSNAPSDEILVRPEDVFNLESPYGDSFISRNPRVDRRGYIGDGEPLTDTITSRNGFEDKRALRDPGLFLIARLRTNRRLFPDVKRKWKSKNMAMWGR